MERCHCEGHSQTHHQNTRDNVGQCEVVLRKGEVNKLWANDCAKTVERIQCVEDSASTLRIDGSNRGIYTHVKHTVAQPHNQNTDER